MFVHLFVVSSVFHVDYYALCEVFRLTFFVAAILAAISIGLAAPKSCRHCHHHPDGISIHDAGEYLFNLLSISLRMARVSGQCQPISNKTFALHCNVVVAAVVRVVSLLPSSKTVKYTNRWEKMP